MGRRGSLLTRFEGWKRNGKERLCQIQQSCAIALRSDIQYMWIDTCCIDKTSSAELSEAINSMYRWYEQAKICYAYLSDVEIIDDLAGSKWFTRGWTLQELIAPQNVKFFNRTWYSFGSKHGLQGRIASITGIPTRVLTGIKPSECSVAQSMSWAADRVTTRPEDTAYCLMGLFEVNMPMLYGEGTRAFARLQEEIIKILDDQSIFAWTGHTSGYSPVLASSPANFKHGAEIRSTSASSDPASFSMTNVGLRIELPLLPYAMNTYLAILQCQDMAVDKDMMPHARSDAGTTRIGILIRRTSQPRQYVRYGPARLKVYQIDIKQYTNQLRTVSVLLLQHMRNLGDINTMYGFYFRTTTSEVFRYKPDGLISTSHNLRLGSSEYQVVCTLPEDTAKRLYTSFPGLISQHSGLAQILRGVHVQGFDLLLEFGENGTVATFTLEKKRAEICTSTIALLKFGFDFDFNPISILYGMASKEWLSHCQGSKGYWADDQGLDEELAKYAKLSTYQCWETHGVCALRGSRNSGLDVVLTHLNIHLTITEGFQDGAKKWIVDISAWVLPFQNFEWNLDAARVELNYAIRERQAREEEVQKLEELHQILNDQTARMDLARAVRRLDEAERRVRESGSRVLYFERLEPK